ncbi:flagellar biosynthesis anti-sigma factor FlgM [Paenibacillus protaetiae]|uniref:Negative regulator of flagellin synthesis n=1 Tax=Paenibacillus protaetiae TaxID=2509456 RepID=A0A4P6F0J1_9BACL|nr:flagellar biosynthesis anti-sigma factor FlgM [Paenibacillus protaetiae]QAY68575.1 flagellar biosynthesis anti-sigma factor FlgM [Paenibacillus protaetiae]
MKINETQRISAINRYQKQNEARTAESGRKKQTDKVQISTEAKEMLLTSQMNGAERASRVAELKKEVSTGTYQVDAGAIAEKLLPYLKRP